jgi:membrane protein
VGNPLQAPLRGFDRWQQRHRVPAILIAVIKKFGDDQGGYQVALLTYFAFLATFPLLLVFTTITEMVLHNNPHLRQQLVDSALSEFPVVGPDLQSSLHTPSGSGFALAAGLVLSLLGGRGLANAVQNALNTLWNVPRVSRPGFPMNYVRSIALLILLGLGAVLTASTAAFAGAGRVFGLSGNGTHVLTLVVTTIIYCGLFLVAFRLATARVIPTRDLAFGAVLSGIAWQVLLTLGGVLVAHYLRHAREVSGVFAAVLGLLGWFALQATVTVYAVEIDVVRRQRLWPRSLTHPPRTKADEKYLTSKAVAEARVPDQRITVEFPSGEDHSSPADRAPEG